MQSTPLRNRKRQWRHSQWLARPGPHPSCLDGHTDVSGGSQSSFLLSFSPPPSNRLFAHPLQTCHLSHYSSALASCVPQYKPGESVSTSQALWRIFDSFNSLNFFFSIGMQLSVAMAFCANRSPLFHVVFSEKSSCSVCHRMNCSDNQIIHRWKALEILPFLLAVPESHLRPARTNHCI